MNPTSEVLKRISCSSKDHVEGVFTRLYRYLLREDIYYTAYNNLYANNGAATKGVDNDTADGFGTEYIAEIIESLRSMKYQPKPVRRIYIPKHNGKMRPLGIPSFRDKLIQDAIRQILEAIYEPIFNEKSHGFRPNRSCHTALESMKYNFAGAKWFIEGDIHGCFDNIEHHKLLDLVANKVKDSKFVNLIGQFLKAGYIENWAYHRTYSGTPQGGILSPILANIYLSELDHKVDKIQQRYEYKPEQELTEVYRQKHQEVLLYQKRLKRHPESPERGLWIASKKRAEKELKKLPRLNQTRKRICYVRYADDFLIGVDGSKDNCEAIKAELKAFLANEMGLELSDEKTKITHSSQDARFLGYDVSIRRSQELKRRKDGTVQRSLNYKVQLNIPLKDKLEAFLLENGYAFRTVKGLMNPIANKALTNRSDYEIVATYASQIRGLCNYYRLASNFAKMDYFVYTMEYSCLKTLASKHQTTMAQARAERRKGKRWGIAYCKAKGMDFLMFPNMTDMRNVRNKNVVDPDAVPQSTVKRNEIKSRLKASMCELCGKENTSVIVHHVARLKDLSGMEPWENKMRKIRRKTLIVCKDCHALIHNKELLESRH